MYRRSSAWRTFALICTIVSCMALALLGPARVIAQGAPPAASPSGSGETFKQEQLDQMLAPIALYPDALLSQILMASTYPLEIVEAARWLDQNKGLTGDALFSALKNQPWDESVKSLCAFPEVLNRMNKDIAWTQKLGDAFLGQPEQVMDTVQSLRKRADAAGNLKSNEQQQVTVENNYITVEPANPQVIYVPTYQPTVVYGVWPYPAYPPYYPPYWVAPGAAFINGVFWGVGIAAGAALWGGFNWNNHDVSINVNRYNNFNRTNISNSNWQHNAAHREGVPYRDNASRQKYGNVDRQAAQAREQFRGREGSPGGSSLNDRAGLQNAAADRGAGGAAGNRDLGTHVGGSATRNFDGAGGGRGGGLNTGNGSQAHDYSNRGNASMGNRSFSSGGGAARGGGGMARGGGRGRR